MAKLKLDKESIQGFFFNHTEKIVLAVVLLLLGLFIWTGSSLEGIGAQSPAELASKVDTVAKKIEEPSWENIKKKYPVTLDHVVRKQVGDAITSESYYRLDTPLIGSPPNSATPRQDPKLFAATDLEATVVLGALAFKVSKARADWKDAFADLANMEQKKIEAAKKRPKKKKKSAAGSMYGPGGDDSYMTEGADEGMDESMYGPGGMAGMYGPSGGDMGMATAGAGPSVRASADKFHGYRPTSTASTSGPSVLGRSYPIVAVKALVPYQQQWDEFERVFADAAGYQAARDVPRYLSFRAERAEVPSDPNLPLKWGLITSTNHALSMIPKFDFAGYPGEIADPKYLLEGVLTMPVPPVMMRDLRGLALHSKVPMQEEKKVVTADKTTPAVADINELGSAPDLDSLPPAGAALPRAGVSSGGMYGPGGSGGDMYGGGDDMYGGGEGMYGGMSGSMYGGGTSPQLVRGPQAEFLMVRFFDHFIEPGKKYVYRVQIVLEDPNHPLNPMLQPLDRNLADTTRTRLAGLAAEEAKQSAVKKAPVRLYTLESEWSEPTAPISISLPSEVYAGGVAQPRTLDIQRATDPATQQKIVYSVPSEGEPIATVMNLSWSSKYAIDLPGIVQASRGAYLSKVIQTDVIDPVSLTYKTIPDYALTSGELVVDLRGGEVLATPADGTTPLLAPGEVAVIDAAGNFIVRNELDDWQTFDRYAPPAPIVVESATSASDPYGEAMMGAGEMESLYGE